MAEPEQALRSLVLADAAVAALVGARMYPATLPQGWTSPALSYQRVSGVRARALGGPPGRAYPRMQIDCWSRVEADGSGGYAEAKSLATAVRQALDGVATTQDGVKIDVVALEDDRDFFERVAGEDIYRVSLDLRLTHDETP